LADRNGFLPVKNLAPKVPSSLGDLTETWTLASLTRAESSSGASVVVVVVVVVLVVVVAVDKLCVVHFFGFWFQSGGATRAAALELRGRHSQSGSSAGSECTERVADGRGQVGQQGQPVEEDSREDRATTGSEERSHSCTGGFQYGDTEEGRRTAAHLRHSPVSLFVHYLLKEVMSSLTLVS